MKKIMLSALALLLFLSTAFTFVHHGWANYDQTKPLDYTGTIKESTYENPHATAKLDVKGQTWDVVLAPTSRMQERGVSAEMLAKGASIRVVGYPHREVKNEMRAERIFVKGKQYEMRR